MLERTFLHLPGVGPATERAIWAAGGETWQDVLRAPERFHFGPLTPAEAARRLEGSIECLERGEHQPFARALGLREAWRAWPSFREKTVFLDIETDGGRSADSVTLIGLYDGEFTGLLKGDDIERFPDLISHYSMIVTFFGSGFDLPMLEKRFRNVRFDQIHLDLCPTFRRVGVGGGLKKIEKEMGISRPDEAEGLTGWDAVKLWRRWVQLGDRDALDTLVAYNREDVVNLERLTEICYARMLEATFAPANASMA